MKRVELDLIESALNTYVLGKSAKNELWDELVSTNDRAIELAKEGEEEGVIVLARQQSAGRGRQGKNWISPKDSGIFISIILRPSLDQAQLPLLSLAAGVAAAEAIEKVVGLKIGLKWVNDLVYEGKKLGGILAEIPGAQKTSINGIIHSQAVILGIGLNLSFAEMVIPDELKDRIVSLDNIAGKQIDANALVAELCNSLESQYNHLLHSAPELVLAEWKKYSHTLGKQVKAYVGSEEIEGTAIGLTDSGALILKLNNGDTQILHAGEISIRLQDGRYA